MGRSLLTVDLGNSAIKLRAWREDGQPRPERFARADFAPAAHDSEDLARFLDTHGPFDLGALSTVADAALSEAWHARTARCVRGELRTDLDCGLENRTLEPARVGRDRLFAARGALELLQQSALVVGVGTAVTVDALLALEGGRGAFLGGAIAPGPVLLARALDTGTARLFRIDPTPDPAALGRDTQAAMRAGVGIGLRGAVRELALEIAREAGLKDPPIALCGGARAFVAGSFGAARVVECEDLVHVGLCAALLSQAGRGPR